MDFNMKKENELLKKLLKERDEFFKREMEDKDRQLEYKEQQLRYKEQQLKYKDRKLKNDTRKYRSKLKEYEEIIHELGEGKITKRGFTSLIRSSTPHLIALAYKKNAFHIFMVMAMLMDNENKIQFSRRDMRDILGVEYKTLENTLEFLIKNKFIRELSNVPLYNRTEVCEYEINYQLAFNGQYNTLYKSNKKNGLQDGDERPLITKENRFFEPLSKKLKDGAYNITIDETGKITRSKEI